jgi:hypothetical protein
MGVRVVNADSLADGAHEKLRRSQDDEQPEGSSRHHPPLADDGAFVERRSGQDRRRGRPPLFVEPSAITCRLEGALHDRLVQAALRRDIQVSDAVRDALERWVEAAERRDSCHKKPALIECP